jgi:hypothetical protein
VLQHVNISSGASELRFQRLNENRNWLRYAEQCCCGMRNLTSNFQGMLLLLLPLLLCQDGWSPSSSGLCANGVAATPSITKCLLNPEAYASSIQIMHLNSYQKQHASRYKSR